MAERRPNVLVADLAANALRVGDLALTQALVVRLKELAPDSLDADRIREDLKRVAANPGRLPREILEAWNPWDSCTPRYHPPLMLELHALWVPTQGLILWAEDWLPLPAPATGSLAGTRPT